MLKGLGITASSILAAYLVTHLNSFSLQTKFIFIYGCGMIGTIGLGGGVYSLFKEAEADDDKLCDGEN
jgi:hypothetical protein